MSVQPALGSTVPIPHVAGTAARITVTLNPPVPADVFLLPRDSDAAALHTLGTMIDVTEQLKARSITKPEASLLLSRDAEIGAAAASSAPSYLFDEFKAGVFTVDLVRMFSLHRTVQ